MVSSLKAVALLALFPALSWAADSPTLPSLAPLVDAVKSSVVNVDVQARGGRGPLLSEPDDLFEPPPTRRRRREPIRQGMGSGAIVDNRGLVLTNNHVVEGAVAIRVRLHDGRSYDAEVVGRDPLTDIALIRLKGKLENLPVARLGDSDAIKVGDWGVAIGNPFGLASSVSLGIISAKERNIGASIYDDFLQTDAAINPGNSGGPLFNLKGEVVGINTAIIGGGSGIGFAVPINVAKALMPQLEKEGAVTRGWLGVGIQTLTPELARAMGVGINEGAVVLSVAENSPAKKAGFAPDDVIVSMDGAKTPTSEGLTRRVALKRPGSTSSFSVVRGQNKLELKAVLGTRPDAEGPRAPSKKRVAAEESRRQRVGIGFQDVDARLAQSAGIPARGAYVNEVIPGSPADASGIQTGMVIVEANRKVIKNAADLSRLLKSTKGGDSVLLRVELPGASGARQMLLVLTLP
jgi:serine protease Do